MQTFISTALAGAVSVLDDTVTFLDDARSILDSAKDHVEDHMVEGGHKV
jgi:isochorismate synthase EntC